MVSLIVYHYYSVLHLISMFHLLKSREPQFSLTVKENRVHVQTVSWGCSSGSHPMDLHVYHAIKISVQQLLAGHINSGEFSQIRKGTPASRLICLGEGANKESDIIAN